MSDVRLLYKGTVKKLYVIAPQDYDCITALTKNHNMMKPRHGEPCGKYNCGLFHTGESGIAQSGDGGDHGDRWYLANDAMWHYLNRKLAFMSNAVDCVVSASLLSP